MAMEVGRASLPYALVTHTPPGRQQAPNPTCFRKRNVEIPYRSPRGQQAARLAHGDAGEGLRTKRTPSCNRMDNRGRLPDIKSDSDNVTKHRKVRGINRERRTLLAATRRMSARQSAWRTHVNLR